MRALTLAAACGFALAGIARAEAQFDVGRLFDQWALVDDPAAEEGVVPPAPGLDALPELPNPIPPRLPPDLSDQGMLTDDPDSAPLGDPGLYSRSLDLPAPPADDALRPISAGEPPLPPQASPSDTDALSLPPGPAAEAASADVVPETIDFEKTFSSPRPMTSDSALAPPPAPLQPPAHLQPPAPFQPPARLQPPAPRPWAGPPHGPAAYQAAPQAAACSCDSCLSGGGSNLPPPVTTESFYRTPACYRNLWDGYAAQRHRECLHQHKHLHGRCACFEEKQRSWCGPALYHSVPSHAAPCHAAPCHAAPCHAVPGHAAPAVGSAAWLRWPGGAARRPLPAAEPIAEAGGAVPVPTTTHCARTRQADFSLATPGPAGPVARR